MGIFENKIKLLNIAKMQLIFLLLLLCVSSNAFSREYEMPPTSTTSGNTPWIPDVEMERCVKKYNEAKWLAEDIKKYKNSHYSINSYNSKVTIHSEMIGYFNRNCAGKQSESAYRATHKLNKNNVKIKEKATIKRKDIIISKYSLSIISFPKHSRIRILNIKPKYNNGMKLKKGKYNIEVSAKGYETSRKWIDLTKNNYFSFYLKKKNLSVKNNFATKEQPKILERSSGIPLQKPIASADDVKHTSLLNSIDKKPNMRHLTGFQNSSIEKTCKTAKDYQGPADYYQCIRKELNKLRDISKKPNMRYLTEFQNRSIEKTCKTAKDYQGPADYYQCIQKELSKLSIL